MAAAQVTTAGVVLIAADPDEERDIYIQNLGPNAIFLEFANGATVVGGLQVAATTGTFTGKLPANTALNAIAATANQASPADTRFAAI